MSMRAEYSIIGTFMLSPELRDMIAESVHVDYMNDDRRDVYAKLLTGHANGVNVDWVWLEEQYGAEQVGDLMTSSLRSANPNNVNEHIEILRRNHKRRACTELLTEGIREVMDSDDPGKTVSSIASKLSDIDKSEDTKSTDYNEILDSYKDDIKSGEDPKCVKYPYDDWNDTTGGMFKGDLIVIGARPGVGKTTVAIDIARQLAKSGYNVAYYLLEMTAKQGSMIVISQETNIGTVTLRSNKLNNAQIDAISSLQPYKGKLHLIDDCFTMDEIKTRSRRIAHKEGLDLIIVDYLQLIRHNSIMDRYSLITDTSGSLKRMCLDDTIGAPVIALSQLSRSNTRAKAQPGLTDLRESGSIEQDADTVMFIHAPQGEEEPFRDILVRKNRWGLFKDMSYVIINRKLQKIDPNQDLDYIKPRHIPDDMDVPF